jgi:hypothetical protein
VTQTLLGFATEIPLQRHYWASLMDSPLLGLPYYVLMTAPSRLSSRLSVGLGAVWDGIDKGSSVDRLWGWMRTQTLLSSSLKAFRPRSEIQKKLKRLALAQKQAAGCIGLLVNNDLGQRLRLILLRGSSLQETLEDFYKEFHRSARTIQRALEFFQRGHHASGRQEFLSVENLALDLALDSVSLESTRLLALDCVKRLSLDLPNELISIQRTSFRPSVTTRLWFPVLSGTLLGLLALRHISLRWNDILFVLSETRKTVVSLVRSWVLEPLYQMYETVRYKESHLRVQGSESLQSDLESLERMVVSFARDNKGLTDPLILSDIAKKTLDGDLTLVLESYEDDLRTPLQSIATGHLIRPLLIQIQKAKVDAAMALSALDRLLRANELNFTFLALLPLLGVLGLTYSWTRNKYRSFEGFGKKTAFQMLQSGLRYVPVFLLPTLKTSITHYSRTS